MAQSKKTTRRFENAVEVWELHDTVLVSPYIDENPKYQGVGFFYNFAQLAAVNEIPFFTVRNSSMVDNAYCNFDSKDRMNFGYKLYSMGIDFIAPSIGGGSGPNDAKTREQIFIAELTKHASFVFKLNQDEKAVNSVDLMPGGSGIVGGTTFSGSGATSSNYYSNDYSNGESEIRNRRNFTSKIMRENKKTGRQHEVIFPMEIPRGVTIQGSLQFSSIGRKILKGLEIPIPVYVNDDPETGQIAAIESSYLIRVSLFGVRYVQGRNQQHF